MPRPGTRYLSPHVNTVATEVTASAAANPIAASFRRFITAPLSFAVRTTEVRPPSLPFEIARRRAARATPGRRAERPTPALVPQMPRRVRGRRTGDHATAHT